MHSLSYFLLPLLASAEFPVLTQPFQLAHTTGLNHVKLSWDLVEGATNYTVVNTDGDVVASSPGNGVDIYDLSQAETFKVVALDDKAEELDSSAEVEVAPGNATIPDGEESDIYDNTVQSSLRVQSKIKIGETFYQYNDVRDDQGFSHFVEQTSTDGYTFSGDTQVLDRSIVCASVSDGFCKLESIKWAQHPTTKEAIMWAHFENAKDYSLGQMAGASGTPGSGEWSFSGAFQPEGEDSRDLTFFADDDGKGYVISAIKTNTDLGLYALDDDWHNVTSKVDTLQPGERREAPAMVHVDGYYYLFTSTANGWYPSEGMYISAQNLSGPWTSSRNIGNAGNFGAQSGQLAKIGDTYLQVSNRWAAQWEIPEGFNRQIMLPIAFKDGVAQYNFYTTLEYNDEAGVVVPVQNGRILSVGKPVNASEGENADAAADGIQSDPDNLYIPKAVPFEWQVDLEDQYTITQVDITPKSVGGSDTYLQYTVEGSADGVEWAVIADESANDAVGFRTNTINSTTSSAEASYRYIKLDVQKVINIHNGNEADWAAGLHEVMVYGT